MQNEQFIFGIRAVVEAITAGENIDKVFIQKEAKGELMQELLKTLKKNNVNFSYVPLEKLNKLSKFNNHQGAVASIAPVRFLTIEELVEGTLAQKETPLLDRKSTRLNSSHVRISYAV